MTETFLRYSKDQLLKIKESTTKSNQFNWIAINNIVQPANGSKTQASFIPSLVPSVFRERQKQINRPCHTGAHAYKYVPTQQRRTVNPNNLIVLPTYSSITDIGSKQLTSSFYGDHAKQKHTMGSRGAHNAHLVDPSLHVHINFKLGTRAHNVLVRETGVKPEEDVDEERHTLSRTSEVPASSEKLVSPDIGLLLQHNLRKNLKSIETKSKPKLDNNRALLPSVLYTNCRSLNEWKLNELNVLMELHHPDLKQGLIYANC